MNRQTIYLYDYVKVPYSRVRARLADEAQQLLVDAAGAAGQRAALIAAQLSVSVAGFEIGREISISVGEFHEAAEGVESARLHLSWQDAHRAGLFPIMDADLEALPLTAAETEIVLAGVYRPPFGRAGSALDAALLHRISEAAVRHFFERIVSRISERTEGPIFWS